MYNIICLLHKLRIQDLEGHVNHPMPSAAVKPPAALRKVSRSSSLLKEPAAVRKECPDGGKEAPVPCTRASHTRDVSAILFNR